MSKRNLSSGFIFNIIGAVVPIIISLAVVPLYIHGIGLPRYGIVTLCWVFLGYFEFLDFGMSRASSNALAKLPPDDTFTRSRVLMTAIYTNFALGIIGGIAMLLVGHVIFSDFIKIPDDLKSEVIAAYPWMAAMLPLGMIGSVLKGAIEAHERFALSNTLNVLSNVGGQVVPLASAFIWSPSLLVVLPALVAVRFFYVVASFCQIIKIERPLHVMVFDRVWLRRLFGYGSWVSVSNLLNPLLDTTNQVVIGSILGSGAVANYSVPMNLAMRSQIVATALARTLFPRMSRVSRAEAMEITQNTAGTLAYGFAIISGPAILFSSSFLHLWIGPRFATESATVAQILLFGAWINGVAFLPYNFLQAQGRPNITAKISLIEILPFFAVLYQLIQWMGLPGAALAWTLRVSINCVALFLLSGCIDHKQKRLLPVIGLMVICTVISILVPMTIVQAFLASLLSFLIFSACSIIFDPPSKRIFARILRKIFRNKSFS